MFLEEIENKDGFYATVNLYDALPATAGNYGIFFTAIKACEVLFAKEVHGTASSSGTITIEKLTGTTAKGSGTAISNDLTTASTADTVQDFVLNSSRQLKVGDRLAVKSGGTLTSSADLQVTLYLKPLGKGDYR
jgi:hypothetical protein